MVPFAAAADTGSRYFVTRTGPPAVNRAMEPLRGTGVRAVAKCGTSGRPPAGIRCHRLAGRRGLGVPGIPGDVR
jgi:hypothetical protein